LERVPIGIGEGSRATGRAVQSLFLLFFLGLMLFDFIDKYREDVNQGDGLLLLSLPPFGQSLPTWALRNPSLALLDDE